MFPLRIFARAGTLAVKNNFLKTVSSPSLAVTPLRSITTESGAIPDKPFIKKFKTIQVIMVVVPFVFLGASISKTGANFLEENDIFVHNEDDDEDDDD